MKIVNTPIGNLCIVAKDGKIAGIFIEEDEPVLQQAAREIQEYFAGTRTQFTVPIAPQGGEFHRRVWQTMTTHPDVGFGKTICYSDLGKLCGNDRAARAVGSANNHNPIPIIIPCHRVVGKGGDLTGFRWGMDVKRKLLEHENNRSS